MKARQLSLVQHFTVNLVVWSCILPRDLTLARVCLCLEMPAVKVDLSSAHYRALMRLADAVTAQPALPPPHRSAAMAPSPVVHSATAGAGDRNPPLRRATSASHAHPRADRRVSFAHAAARMSRASMGAAAHQQLPHRHRRRSSSGHSTHRMSRAGRARKSGGRRGSNSGDLALAAASLAGHHVSDSSDDLSAEFSSASVFTGMEDEDDDDDWCVTDWLLHSALACRVRSMACR